MLNTPPLSKARMSQNSGNQARVTSPLRSGHPRPRVAKPASLKLRGHIPGTTPKGPSFFDVTGQIQKDIFQPVKRKQEQAKGTRPLRRERSSCVDFSKITHVIRRRPLLLGGLLQVDWTLNCSGRPPKAPRNVGRMLDPARHNP
jgi:hypothetical protein